MLWLQITVIVWMIVGVESWDFGLRLGLGLSPNYYKRGDSVDLLVNKVESDHTQLPYAYYDLDFVCPHTKGKKAIHLSLGDILRGDRLWQSDYNIKFGVDIQCARLCDFNVKESQIKHADQLIKQGYVVHWSLDGLPGATTFVSDNKYSKYYAAGFPLGFFKKDISYIYNHYMLVIRYHTEKEKPGYHTIVGFEVYPKSVIDETCPGSSKNYENLPMTLKKNAKGKISKIRIPYTYSVYWREDNSIDYANRWSLYYENETNSVSKRIHWVSFFNSIALLVLLTMIVVVIFLKVFKSDLKRSSSSASLKELETNGNWKNLSNDVLKKPAYPLMLSISVAAGMQLIIASVGVILLIIIKSQFDQNRAQGTEFNNYQGAFSSFALTCFVLSGIIPSFFGIILHKFFHNDNINVEYPISKKYKLSLLFSGFLPALILSVMLFLNIFVFAKESCNALPFGTIVVLLIIFFLVVLPLGFIGAFYGNKIKFDKRSYLLSASKDIDSFNSTTFTPAPRSKRHGSLDFFKNTLLSMIIYGLIPFGIVYVELSFILNSVWLEKTTFYYMYGFLFLTTITLIVIVAESTIIGLFVNLVMDCNPKWQWLSFRIGSSIGLYIYTYSIFYFFSHLNIRDFVSIILYFGYMALVSLLVSIASGSVAVITALIFIRKAYGSNKVD